MTNISFTIQVHHSHRMKQPNIYNSLSGFVRLITVFIFNLNINPSYTNNTA